MEYIVFTDESSITDSRFQSLSAFSLPFTHYDELKSIVNKILKESNVTEFKWQKLKDAKNFFCAEKLINFLFQNIHTCNLRVDTIIWDTHKCLYTFKPENPFNFWHYEPQGEYDKAPVRN
jgi:hypothetical protein